MSSANCTRCGGSFDKAGKSRRKLCDACRGGRHQLPSTNREAAELTVAALREVGALEGVDEATVMAFLSLASAVDSPDVRADLWREYRAFASALREAADGGSDDDTQAFFIHVQTPRGGRATMGDAEKP